MYDGALYAVPNHHESRPTWAGWPCMNGTSGPPTAEGDELSGEVRSELNCGDGDESLARRHARAR